MSNSKICILDHKSLGELNNAFEYAADSVLKVQRAIAVYLSGVIEVMEHQLEIVAQKFEEAKERLNSAKERLAEAETSLASAQERMSQSMDCGDDSAAGALASAAQSAAYAAAVAAARARVVAAMAECEVAQANYDKWERNYETAKKVVAQCKAYKSDWEYQAPFVSGGDLHLEMLGKYYTDEATKKLKKIAEVIEKYLNISISSRRDSNPEDVEVLNKYDREKIITNSDFIVRKEQIEEMNRHGAVAANRVARCERCGRPLSICICGNSRKNIELL